MMKYSKKADSENRNLEKKYKLQRKLGQKYFFYFLQSAKINLEKTFCEKINLEKNVDGLRKF